MDLRYFTRPKAFGLTAPIQIPLVTQVVHKPSAGPFVEFPKRLGFNVRDGRISRLDIEAHTADEVTRLLQSWLFFGLLAEFLNRDIDVRAFVSERKESQHQTLDFSILEETFVEWKDSLGSMSEMARTKRKEHFLECLEVAIFQGEEFDNTSLDFALPQFAPVALSAKLLILLLKSLTLSTFAGDSGPQFAESKRNGPVHLLEAEADGHQGITCMPESVESDLPRLMLPLPPGIQIESASPAAKLLIDRMLHAGWCIHLVRKLCRSYDYMTVNYLSLIHRDTDPSKDHKACFQATQCIANNVTLEGNAAYTTRHADPHCQCSFLTVDTAKLISIIRKGEIPLILITQGPNGPRIALVRRNPRTNYAAFSHVWADGLGNPSANGLPQCQIQRLWSHVRSLRAQTPLLSKRATWGPTRSPFYPFQELIWIDTLCIPVGSAHDADIQYVKTRAINHMAPIYAEAAVVFVLDSELQRVKVYDGTHGLADDEIGATELSALLLCSSWMGRTWTLQEAVVSRHCRYVLGNRTYCPGERWEFQNQPGQYWATKLSMTAKSLLGRAKYYPESYDVVPLLPWLDPRSDPTYQKQVSPLSWAKANLDRTLSTHFVEALDLDREYLQDASFQLRTEPPFWRAKQFARTWNRLLDRSTTKSEDQHAVFATLLDFNAYQIRSLEAVERMPAIIRSCDELPLSLLFNNGPRFAPTEAPENGWIPSAVSGDRLNDSPVLQQTSRGFVLTNNQHGSLYLFAFRSSLIVAHNFCLHDVGSGQDFFMELNVTPGCLLPQENANIEPISDVPLQHGQEACIIFDKQTGTSSPQGFLAAGVLLSISRRDAHAISVKYVCPLLVRSRGWVERLHRQPLMHVTIAAERCQGWKEVILEYNAQACGDRLTQRPAIIYPWELSVTLITVTTVVLSLACAAVAIVLSAKKLESSGRNVAPLVWSLSITLGFLSFLFGGFVQKACVRACTEAWISTFNEDWRPGAADGLYGWVTYLPTVLGSKDSKTYRDERSWAIDEKWKAEENLQLVGLVHKVVAPFHMFATAMAAAWSKLHAPIAGTRQPGIFP